MATNKRKLYLIGAGELGREIESWLSLDDVFMQNWEITGFLDRNLNALDGYPSDYTVIGIPETFHFQDGDAAIMCVANPVIKERIVKNLSHKVEFISYVAKTAIVGKFTHIGRGCVVCPGSIISTNAIIEEFVTINCSSNIGHDCIVCSYTSLMPHTDLGGHVKVGEKCFLGTKTTIIPGRQVSDNIFTGAGSVVMRNLKKEGTYYGNPATLLKY